MPKIHKKRKYSRHVAAHELEMARRALKMASKELDYSKEPSEELLRQFYIIFYGWESGLFNFYNSTDANLKINWYERKYHVDGMTYFLQRNVARRFNILQDEYRFSLRHMPLQHKLHAWQRIRLDARPQVEHFLARIKSNCARETRAKTMAERVNLYQTSRDFVKECNKNGDEFRIKNTVTMYRCLHGQQDIDLSRFNNKFTAFSLKESVAKQHVSKYRGKSTINVTAIFDPGCVLLPVINVKPAAYPSLYEYLLPPLDCVPHTVNVLMRHTFGEQLVDVVVQISPAK